MAENETPAQQPGTAVEQITAKAKKKRKHQEFLRQLHALPHDFRTRLNSSELRDVGKEFIKAQNKQLKNADHRSYGLNPTEFEQVMGALGFEDLPMMKCVFGIFDLNGDGEVDYHELVCCVDLLLRGVMVSCSAGISIVLLFIQSSTCSLTPIVLVPLMLSVAMCSSCPSLIFIGLLLGS